MSRRSLESTSFFAILDSRGVMIDQDADRDEAYARAEHASPTGTVIVDAAVDASDELEQNPPKVTSMRGAVAKAAEASKIPFVDEDWATFDPLSNKKVVDSARAALRDRGKKIYAEILESAAGTVTEPQRKGERGKRGGIATQFDAGWLANDLLRQNQKMSKLLEGSDAMYDSIGLSLLPHGASFREPLSTSTDQGPRGATLCLYSTPQCRKVCLVNTGQRALESGAFAASYLFSRLVREMPEAFLVNLFDRCVNAFTKADTEGFYRFIRLNVLSDVPWEVIAPGFIEAICDRVRPPRWSSMADGHGFYDYTKIPYRRGIDDYYDITLSFSGSTGMFPAFYDVLEGERDSAKRCAVVFVKREEKQIRHRSGDAPYRASPGVQLKSLSEWHAWDFMGHRVWNGDLSDVRPLDEDEVKVVGLTYKPPRYKVTAVTKGKKFGLVPVVSPSQLDAELPTFLVRVRQPDPEAPPIVMATQDPDNRKLLLPVWKG